MSEKEPSWCEVWFEDGVCGNPPTSGLEICGSCLRTLLDEPDPRRRRSLATHPRLAAGLVQQLAEDPDDQVRAQVAARGDLDTATTNRLADPDRESSPKVLGSMAATAGGAVHAWELLGTDDPTTLSILAANPLVDRDILDHLSRYPNPDVAWTASATLAGQPAGDVSIARVAEVRAFDGLPISEPEPRLARPTAGAAAAMAATTTVATAPTAVQPAAAAGGAGMMPPRPPADAPVETNHRRTALLVGAGVFALVAIVVLAVVFSSGGDDTPTTAIGPGPATVTLSSIERTTTSSTTSTTASTTTSTSTTSTTTTTMPITTTPPPPTATPTQPAVVVPPPSGPVSQTFTIRPASGRFCESVAVTVNFSPSPGDVTVSDDTGARVGSWSGASGQTRSLSLPRPTSSLLVTVTVTGQSISVSGSASGASC